MEPDAVTFLSHGLVVYLLAPVIILLLVSIHKESRGENPLKRDSMVWCSDDGAVALLLLSLTTLHRATVSGKINRIETASSQVR